MDADIIIIGGGVAGLSTAVQLAGRSQRVILLEKGELASGSTSLASGLLGQLRSNAESTRMLMDSLAILRDLETEDGANVFTQSGSVRVAQTEPRAGEIERSLAVAKVAGLEARPIDRAELARRLPYTRTDDVISACYCPTDGYLRPMDLARLYIRAAERRGVELRRNSPVEQIVIRCGRVRGCAVQGETIEAPIAINAAGPWSYLVAELADTRLPTAGIGHCYLTFGPDTAVPIDPLSPTLRDRENLIYSRPTREGALHIGIYETEPILYDMDALSPSFRMLELRTALDHPTIRALFDAAQRRFPFLTRETPVRITTGIMSWTPDGQSLCGRAPDIEGLFHCAGFCGHGVMQSAAIGVLMADLILDGRSRYDLSQIEADRFHDLPELEDRATVEMRCRKAYANAYSRIESH